MRLLNASGCLDYHGGTHGSPVSPLLRDSHARVIGEAPAGRNPALPRDDSSRTSPEMANAHEHKELAE